MKLAQRIQTLPPYLFARIDELKQEQRARGVDVIDLGIGDPDLPTPPHIVAALKDAAAEPAHHRYPSYAGMAAFRAAAARFCQRRFGVALDPATEVLALIGSKEGVAHLPLALVDPGDVVLCPDPGYPVYATGTRFAGGEVYPMPLRRERGFLPDLHAIPPAVAARAALIWVNYPNNPTAARAPRAFYEELVAFARAHDIVIASDLAYSEMYLDGEPPPSILEIPGARDVAIELHSLSKTYNMTGWRVGFAVGNPALVGALGKVKTNVDSGVFEAVQRAAIAALDGDQACVEVQRQVYRERRQVLCGGLARAGYDVLTPSASFYCLVAVPAGTTALDWAGRILAETGVVVTPATGFGAGGEGFVRLTLCADAARLEEAVRRLVTLAPGR
jgi:LL-diaminopimelate aminotransferase